jgi:hypothetical protein
MPIIRKPPTESKESTQRELHLSIIYNVIPIMQKRQWLRNNKRADLTIAK